MLAATMKNKDVPAATILIFTLLSLAFIVLSAFIFSRIEDDWDFLTALYFVVITMSTIGYGDLSPSSNLSKILTIVFIYISLFILFAIFQAIINYCINRHVYIVKERIYRRVNRAVADQSLLDDMEDSSEETFCANNNKCCNFIFNACTSSYSTVLYLILYLVWLALWSLYFSQWSNSQKEIFSTFDAVYFGVITSSTVGYGDVVPFIEDQRLPKIFTLSMAIVGVVLLATLAGKISTILISLLISTFHCNCCKCCNIDTSNGDSDDGMQLSKETILNIKKNGAIDLRTFLAIQYSKDEQFVEKLETGCDLFDKYDSDGNKAIEFEELKKEYRKQRQIKTQQKLMKDYLVANDNNETEMAHVVPEHSNQSNMSREMIMDV